MLCDTSVVVCYGFEVYAIECSMLVLHTLDIIRLLYAMLMYFLLSCIKYINV